MSYKLQCLPNGGQRQRVGVQLVGAHVVQGCGLRGVPWGHKTRGHVPAGHTLGSESEEGVPVHPFFFICLSLMPFPFTTHSIL